jgi:hypothetical protein
MAAADPLRRIHGDVRPLHQRDGVLAVLRVDGDADAGADVEFPPVDDDRPPQALQDLLRGHDGPGLVRPGQDGPELVPAQAGDQVRLPEGIP